ncbi:MAG: hypothetical protein ACYTHN_02545, partial [Planctomycetota bacterium]
MKRKLGVLFNILAVLVIAMPLETVALAGPETKKELSASEEAALKGVAAARESASLLSMKGGASGKGRGEPITEKEDKSLSERNEQF